MCGRSGEGRVVGELGDFVACAVGFDADDVLVVLHEACECFGDAEEEYGAQWASLCNAGVELEGFACVAVDADLSLGRFGFVVEKGDVFDEVVAEAEVGEARL